MSAVKGTSMYGCTRRTVLMSAAMFAGLAPRTAAASERAAAAARIARMFLGAQATDAGAPRPSSGPAR
jgi:hypothetical protein